MILRCGKVYRTRINDSSELIEPSEAVSCLSLRLAQGERLLILSEHPGRTKLLVNSFLGLPAPAVSGRTFIGVTYGV
jgi:hypothetical protein